MNLSRSAVVALFCVSLPLAVACGSVSDDLFSNGGGATQSAGANGAHAGASAAGAADGGRAPVAGAPSAGAGAVGEAGDSNGGAGAVSGGGGAEPEGGSTSGGAGGEAMGGSSGEPMGGAAGSMGGASGGAAGANAGSGGASAGSGGGGPGPVCPPAAPQDGGTCTVSTPNSCFYPGQACSCLPTGGGPNAPRKWACFGDGPKCPEVKPSAGLACKQYADAECPYPNNEYCACIGNNDPRWTCSSTPTCSASKPPATYCGQSVKVCGYAEGVECFCSGGSAWQCLAP